MKHMIWLHLIEIVAMVAANDVESRSSSDETKGTIDPRQRMCDPKTEHQCVQCSYSEDGTPEPHHYCVDNGEECPPGVCCNIRTEETCYDRETSDPVSCARYVDGGCPCTDAEVKCGVNEHSSGYCTTLCCDWKTEQTCYDQHWNPASCQKYEEGDCPDEFILGSLNPQVERMNYSDGKQEWNELT